MPVPHPLEFAAGQMVMMIEQDCRVAVDMGTCKCNPSISHWSWLTYFDLTSTCNLVSKNTNMAHGWIPDTSVQGQWLKLDRFNSVKGWVWTIEFEGKFLGLSTLEPASHTQCWFRETDREKRKLQEWFAEYDTSNSTFR